MLSFCSVQLCPVPIPIPSLFYSILFYSMLIPILLHFILFHPIVLYCILFYGKTTTVHVYTNYNLPNTDSANWVTCLCHWSLIACYFEAQELLVE